MLPDAVVRGWQFELLEKSLASFGCIVEATPVDDLRTWRDGGRGWTALEVLCHLGDFEEVFQERARVTLTQSDGALPFPDPDRMAAERRYNEQDARSVQAAWAGRRRRLLDLLKPLTESRWQRTALHPKRGLMSLQDQLALITWHDANHMEQMLRTLREKRR